jgi:hypothetical protein
MTAFLRGAAAFAAVVLVLFSAALSQAQDNTVQISNTTADAVAVIGIGAQEQQELLAEIAAGETQTLTLPAGMTLGFSQSGAWLGDAYRVSGIAGEAMSVPYTAAAAAEGASGEAPVDPDQPQLTITNGSGKPITVISIAADETQEPLRELAAGETYRQPAAIGTTFGFAQDDGWLGDAYVFAGSPEEAVTVPYRAEAAAPGPRTEEFVETTLPPVQITNGSDKPVTIVSIQPDDTQFALKELAAGETYPQPATPGTRLGFVQDEAWLGDAYVTTGDPGEAVTVPFRQMSALQLRHQGPDSVGINFDNKTGSPLLVAVTDEQDQAEILYELPPGASERRALPEATLWFYKDGEDLPTGDAYVVTEIEGQAVSLPFSAAAVVLAAQEGSGSVALDFTNTNMVPIVVSVVGADNRAAILYQIPPGQIVTRRALPGSQLWFFRQGEEEPVGESFMVPEKDAALSLPYDRIADLKAQQAGPGSITLEIRNETYGAIHVAIVDANGFRADLQTIAYRNSAETGRGTDIQAMPGTELLFFSEITEAVDGELRQKLAGVATVESTGPRIVYLPFQPGMATQKDPSPPGAVSVKFRNITSGEVPELLFVDSEGENLFTLYKGLESWRNLAPGTTLFTYGRDNPDDIQFSINDPNNPDAPQYSVIGDPIVIGSEPGQTFEAPFTDNTVRDLIAAGKIDIQAIITKITADLAKADLDNRRRSQRTACWKDTYGRGVGTVPRDCPPGQSEDTAGLCYDNCRSGYRPFATMCIPTCPEELGFKDTGLHCDKPGPKERIAYPWQAFDPFNMDGAMARCRADFPKHRSECVLANHNTMVYTACPDKYEQAPIITSLCTPKCPENTTTMGVACRKNTYDRGVGRLMSCGAGQQNDAGLCYNSCRSGFDGIGPVCWAQCPKEMPVNCGASCARDMGECAMAVTDQVTTPFMAAASIALIALTAGAGSGATAALNTTKAAASTAGRTGTEIAAKVGIKEAARKGLKATVRAALRSGAGLGVKGKAAVIARDLAIETAVGAAVAGGITAGLSDKAKTDLREQLTSELRRQLESQISDEQIDTIVDAAIDGSGAGNLDFPWTTIDPTGIAEIVRSYNLPMCSTLQ